MKKLFLAWQEPKSHHWFPIGCLEFDGDKYHFFYIQGVEKARSEGFTSVYSLPQLDKIYSSTELFPLFSNRLMSRSRADYPKYIESLNISAGADDPMTVLSKSGGIKATDTYEVFPYPEIDEKGNYHTCFFVHGLRYMPKCSIDKAVQLKQGDLLYLSHDFQNSYDPKALLLRTEDGHNLGYCPRYLSQDIFTMLQEHPQQVKVRIDLVNPAPAPMQFRLLCNLTAEGDSFSKTLDERTFRPFAGDDYQPLKTIQDRL